MSGVRLLRRLFLKSRKIHKIAMIGLTADLMLKNKDKMAQQVAAEWCLVDEAGHRIKLPQTMVFLGRQDCDINIQSSSIDHRHAVFTFDHKDKKFRLKDLGSLNGTFLNDKKIPDDDYVTLEHLDTVRFGFDSMSYRMERLPAVDSTTSSSPIPSGSYQSITSSSSASISSAGSGMPERPLSADDGMLLSPSKDLPAWATRDAAASALNAAERSEQPGGLIVAECPGCIAEHGVPHSCGISDESIHVPNPPTNRWHHDPSSSLHHHVYTAPPPSAADYYHAEYPPDYYPAPPPPQDSTVVSEKHYVIASQPIRRSSDAVLDRPGYYYNRQHNYQQEHMEQASSGVKTATSTAHSVDYDVEYSNPHPPYHRHPVYPPPPRHHHHYPPQMSHGPRHAPPPHSHHPSHYYPPSYHPAAAYHPHHPPSKDLCTDPYYQPPPCSQCEAALRGQYEEYPAPGHHHSAPHGPQPPPGPARKSAFSVVPPNQPQTANNTSHPQGYNTTTSQTYCESKIEDNSVTITSNRTSTTTTSSSVTRTSPNSKICDSNESNEKLPNDIHSDLEKQPVRDSEEFTAFGCPEEVSVTSVQKIAKEFISPTSSASTINGFHTEITMATSTISSSSSVSTATLIMEQPTKDTDPVVLSSGNEDNAVPEKEAPLASAEDVDVKDGEAPQKNQRRPSLGGEGSTLYGQPAWWGEEAKEANATPPTTDVAATPDPSSTAAPSQQDKYHTDPQYATTYMEISMLDSDAPLRPKPKLSGASSAHTPPEKDTASASKLAEKSNGENEKDKDDQEDDAKAAFNSSGTAFTIDFGTDSTSFGGMKESKSLSQFLPSKVRKSFKQRSSLGKERKDKKKDGGDSPPEGKADHTFEPGRRKSSLPGGSPQASPDQRRRTVAGRGTRASTHQHRAAASGGGGYHSEGQQSEPSSDGEDLSIKSDIVNTTKTGSKKSSVETSRVTKSSVIHTEMKSSTSKSSTRSKTEISSQVQSGTFIIESAKAPNELASKQYDQAVSQYHEVEYIEPVQQEEYTEDYRSTVQECKEFDSSTFTRSSAKLRAKERAAGGIALAGAGAGTETSLRKSVTTNEQRNSLLGLPSGGATVGEEVGDNVSEAGTYTIEGDGEEEEVHSARESIDSVFGIGGGGKADGGGEENGIQQQQSQEEEYEEIDDLDTKRGLRSRSEGMKSYSEQQIFDEDKGGCVEISSDAPRWVSQWASLTGNKTLTRSLDSSVDPSLSTVRPPPTTRRSRPGTGRKLPTPPVSAASTPRGTSASPQLTPRGGQFDFSSAPKEESTEEEDGRHRATVTFDSDGGGFFEVSYDAPSIPKDSPRRSESRERSADEMGVDTGSPRYSRRTGSARSTASLDTEILLRDTEHVMKAMEERVEKNGQQKEFNPHSTSPIDKAQLFLPINDGDDTDDDVSAKVLLNGDDSHEVAPPPAPRAPRAPRSAGVLDSKGQPIQIRRSISENTHSASTKTMVSSKEKLLAQYHSRTSKRNSMDNDNVGVSDDSESASVISTSTDYSAAASPKLTRKATAKPKGNITMTRTNRAFALRRQNADSDTELTPRSTRSTSLTRPNSAGSRDAASPRVSNRSSYRSRPSSAKESSRSSARSDVSLGQKIVNKSRESQHGSSSSTFVRKDGGRHSLRTQKSSPAPSHPPSSSRDLSKPKTSSRLRSNTTGSGLAITGATPTSSSRSSVPTSKTQDYEAWKRRKTYDPRKSLAQAKSKKDEEKHDKPQQPQAQQSQRRTRSAGQTSSTEQWSRSRDPVSSVSSEESSYTYSRTAEISQFSSSMTKDLAKMTQHAVDDDEAFKATFSSSASASSFRSLFSSSGGASAFSALAAPVPTRPTVVPVALEARRRVLSAVSLTTPQPPQPPHETYDDLLVSSVYQLSLKLRSQTDNLMAKMKSRGDGCGSPSPIEDILAQQSIDAANPELPEILQNLRHMEGQLKAMDRTMFPDSAKQSSPTDQRQYQRNLERIQQELCGFKPIDKPTSISKSSTSVAKTSSVTKSHARTRSWHKKPQRSHDSNGSDPLAGSDYY